MFHNIVAILMTNAVMLHALLGCCAHHVHACDSHETITGEASCSHDHHNHNYDQHGEEPTSQSDSNDGDRGGHEDSHESCDEANCIFVSTERSGDVTFVLSLVMWSPLLGNTAIVTTLHEPTYRLSGMTHPSDQLSSKPLCAQTQVWLL